MPMPSRPRYSVPADRTRIDLAECFRLWGVSAFSVNETRTDRHGGGHVAIEFRRGSDRFRIEMRSFPDIRSNLRAAYLEVDAARLSEVRGGKLARDTLAQYLLGDGLPGGMRSGDRRSGGGAPVPPPAADDPWAVLGLMRGHADASVVRAVYQARMKAAHPDAGGTNEAAAKVNNAYRQIMAELGERP